MIYLFHGDNQLKSREAFNLGINSQANSNIQRFDSKNFDLDIINSYINSPSLIPGQKVLAITNLFSINKASLDKILKIINSPNDIDVYIWQDKKLNASQIKAIPSSKVNLFPLSRSLFNCLNSIRPNNASEFLTQYHLTLKNDPLDLFIYLLKNSIRKQLTTYSRLPADKLKSCYLRLIELDYQNKTGQLSTPREIALERIILQLIN